MKQKSITAITMALLLLFAMSGATYAAKTAHGTVTGVKETVVTLDCGDDAGKLVPGETVKIKPQRSKAIEGC